MKIVIIEPKKEPYTANINDKLEEYQAIVDGYIETVFLNKDLILVCNEEGRLKNLEPNRVVGNEVIVGTFFIVGNDAPEFRDLSEQECELIINTFCLTRCKADIADYHAEFKFFIKE